MVLSHSCNVLGGLGVGPVPRSIPPLAAFPIDPTTGNLNLATASFKRLVYVLLASKFFQAEHDPFPSSATTRWDFGHVVEEIVIQMVS